MAGTNRVVIGLFIMVTNLFSGMMNLLYFSGRSMMALMLFGDHRQPLFTGAGAVNALQRKANAYHEKVNR